jgi:hypothetical protein
MDQRSFLCCCAQCERFARRGDILLGDLAFELLADRGFNRFKLQDARRGGCELGTCRGADSNRRPPGYESSALNQLSYRSAKP